MAKQETLDRIDELMDEYAGETHASLNARPGVRIADVVRGQLSEIRDLVDAIDEAEG